MDKYIIFFYDYVERFDTSINMISLKREHTTRVLGKCFSLASGLGLNKEDIETAMIIGLFHDIGRFYQYTEYGSFSDYKTIDHGEMGVKILENSHILDDNPNKELIYKAIRNHNKFELEQNLTDREKLFCNIIRDADKLDILELVIEGKVKVYNTDEEYDSNAVDDILLGRPLLASKYSSKASKSLVRFGFINDLNFDYSKRYILENNILDDLVNVFLESNPKGKDDINKIKTKLNERLGN